LSRQADISLFIFWAILLSAPHISLKSQNAVLNNAYSFNEGEIRKGNALNLISRRTGYYLTYDSRIVNPEEKTILISDNSSVSEILRGIFQKDSIRLTVIGNHIIISKVFPGMSPDAILSSPGNAIRIEGQVTDRETGEPLPFATVAIRNKPRGSVANIDGFFSLSITADLVEDTLSVSFIGFLNRNIPVREALGNDFNIAMSRDYIPIPEIIIRSQIPEEIIRRCVEATSVNFGETPATMWGFYREGVKKGKELQVYSEAVVRVFKASYSSPSTDQIKVERSRKVENIDASDTLVLRLKAGLGSTLVLDGMKNRFEFMDEEFMPLYNFSMTDIVTIDDQTAYVIEFVQKEAIREPLFRGSLMINTSDYALMQAEFEFNPTYIGTRDETFVSSPSRGFTIRPASIKYLVNYRKSGERYFLSHVRGDLRFSARKRRGLFISYFDVFFEMAITSASTQNAVRFDRDEIIPVQTVFSKTINAYDREFWGNFDFLKPEDDLIKKLSSITQRISGYVEGVY